MASCLLLSGESTTMILVTAIDGGYFDLNPKKEKKSKRKDFVLTQKTANKPPQT